MNKMLLMGGVATLAAGAAGAAPYYVGKQIEVQLREQLAQATSRLNLPPGMTLSLDSYSRGYARSTAYTSLMIDSSAMQRDAGAPSAVPETVKITFRHDIEHGPFIAAPSGGPAFARYVSTFVPDDELAGLERHYFGDQPFFKSVTSLDFDGDGDTSIVIPPYQGPAHVGDATVNWQGLNFEIKGNGASLTGKGEMAAPLLEITRGRDRFVMRDLRMGIDTRLSPQGMGLGTVTLTMADLHGSGNGAEGRQERLALSDFRFHVASTQSGNLMSIAEEFGFSQFGAGDMKFKDGTLRLVVNNLDADTMKTLQDTVQQQYRELPSDADPAVMQAMWLKVLAEALPGLLKYSPEFLVEKAEVRTGDGLIGARLKLVASGEVPAGADGGMPDLLSLLNGELDVRIPAALVIGMVKPGMRQQIVASLDAADQVVSETEIERQSHQATMNILDQLEQQNFVTRSGDDYSAELRFRDRHLFLNGTPADQVMQMLQGAGGDGV